MIFHSKEKSMKSSRFNNTSKNLQILRLFLIISLSINSIRTEPEKEDLNNRPQSTVNASNSGVVQLTPENMQEEISRVDFGFVMFTSDDKHSRAIETYYHETSDKLRTTLTDNKKDITERQMLNRKNLQNLGFFLVDTKKYPEYIEKYAITSFPHFIWFNNPKDHYQIYKGETERPSFFFNFALKQIEYKIEETSLENLLKFPEEKELNGENLILFIGNDKGKNNFYFTHLMQCAFNNDIVNLYKSNDEKIRTHFGIKFKNDVNNFDAILFRIRNKKIDLNQYERLNISGFDFMQLDRVGKNALSNQNYSKNFDLAKARPIKKINEMMQLYFHHPVTVFSHKKEKLLMSGLPTLTLVHDYAIESNEYKDMLLIFSEISRRYRKELFFMISTRYSKLTQLYAESFSLQKQNFPALCLTATQSTNEDQQRIDKFRAINAGEVYTLEKITNFIEDWKNMKIPVYHPSEEVPEEIKDEDGIYKFVADNFSKVFNNNKKFILMNLCSDRLEVCEKFRERLIRISHKLKNSDRIIIGEFNPYLNEIEEMFEVRYVPSLFLIPDRGDRFKDMKRYTGTLTTRDIMKWVIEETNLNDFEENKLPLEETLMMEEDLTDLKLLDLENKSASRAIYSKLMDPVQRELWKFPLIEDIELEQNYYEDFYAKYFNPKVVKELSGNNKNDEL